MGLAEDPWGTYYLRGWLNDTGDRAYVGRGSFDDFDIDVHSYPGMSFIKTVPAVASAPTTVTNTLGTAAGNDGDVFQVINLGPNGVDWDYEVRLFDTIADTNSQVATFTLPSTTVPSLIYCFDDDNLYMLAERISSAAVLYRVDPSTGSVSSVLTAATVGAEFYDLNWTLDIGGGSSVWLSGPVTGGYWSFIRVDTSTDAWTVHPTGVLSTTGGSFFDLVSDGSSVYWRINTSPDLLWAVNQAGTVTSAAVPGWRLGGTEASTVIADGSAYFVSFIAYPEIQLWTWRC